MFKRIVPAFVLISSLFAGFPVRADSTIPPVQRLGTGIPTSIAASPDAKTLAVGSSIGVWLLDADTLQPFTFWDTGFWVNSVAYSTDGKYVKANETVLDAGSGGRADVQANGVEWIEHKCILRLNLCAESFLGSFGVTNSKTAKEIWIVSDWTAKDSAWSLDGKKFYGVTGGNIQSWAVNSWQPLYSLRDFFTGALWQVVWSPDNKSIASKNSVWNVTSAQIAGERDCWDIVHWNVFGCTVPATINGWSEVDTYDQKTGQVISELIPHLFNLWDAHLSSDGSILVSSGADSYDRTTNSYISSTKVWDPKTRKLLSELPVGFMQFVSRPMVGLSLGNPKLPLRYGIGRQKLRFTLSSKLLGRSVFAMR